MGPPWEGPSPSRAPHAGRRREHPHRPTAPALVLVLLLVAVVCGGVLRPPPASASSTPPSPRARLGRARRLGHRRLRVGPRHRSPHLRQQLLHGLAPASNMKLVTSAAALIYWGADHRFSTGLYAPESLAHAGVLVRRPLPPRARRPQPLHALATSATSSTSPRPRSRPSRTHSSARASRRSRAGSSATPPGSTSWRTVPYLEERPAARVRPPLRALPATRGSDNGNRVARAGDLGGQAHDHGRSRNAGVKVKGKPGAGKVAEHGAGCVKRQYSAALGGSPAAHEPGERRLLRRDAAQRARARTSTARAAPVAGTRAEQGHAARRGGRDRHLRRARTARA